MARRGGSRGGSRAHRGGGGSRGGGIRRRGGGPAGRSAPMRKRRRMDELEEKHVLDTYDAEDGNVKVVEEYDTNANRNDSDYGESESSEESEGENPYEDLLKEFGKDNSKKSHVASDEESDEDSEVEESEEQEIENGTGGGSADEVEDEEVPIEDGEDEELETDGSEDQFEDAQEDLDEDAEAEEESGDEKTTPKTGVLPLDETADRLESSDDDANSSDEEEEDDANYRAHIEWEPTEGSFPPIPYILGKDKTQNWPSLGPVRVQEPSKTDNSMPPIPLKPNAQVKLKSILQTNIELIARVRNELNDKASLPKKLTTFENSVLNILNTYRDFYYPERSWENAESLRLSYTLHCLNHVLRSRAKSVRHSTKIKRSQGDLEFQDQGLTRIKTLILVPFKDSAYRIVKIILSALNETKLRVINEDRFENEFRPPDEQPKGSKPDDFHEFFKGDTDDMFRIGLRLSKKRIHLYSSFYSSDILIASPVGLRAIIGAEGDEKRDFDFLSSIEMVIMDQVDVFFMQNWEHVVHIFQHLNIKPRESHGVDFSRVRGWCVNEWSKFFRQNVIISQVQHPQINALIKRYNFNYRGLLTGCSPSEESTISQVVIHAPQIFRSFDANTYAEVGDLRFEYFTKELLPQLMKDTLVSHCLIYVRQYFDFIRLRNFMRDLAEREATFKFGHICEYTEKGKVAQTRYKFFHGKTKFLLYSERFHFFYRYTIKGVRHVVFYELPTYPNFYPEIVNLMTPSNQYKLSDGMESTFTASSMYSKYDTLALMPILGAKRTANVVHKRDQKVHLFTRD